MMFEFRRLSSLFLSLVFIFILGQDLIAQRSAAELISTVPPPVGKIKFNDGCRQVSVLDNYLLITNFWAGLQVVDISDIRNPVQVAYLPTEDQAYSTFVDSNYAFLANHAAGVQMYDLSDMQNIRTVATIKTTGNAYSVWADFPNLYVALGNEGFSIMDLTDTENPTTIKLEIPGSWIQQVYKQGDLLYMAAKKGGVIIYDISDPSSPKLLSQYKTGFNTMEVKVLDNIAYVADGPGGLLLLNVENPEFPVEIERFSDQGFVSNLHKVGNYVYLANSDIGLQIVNITDLQKPFLETQYETNDRTYGVFKKDIHVFLAVNVATLIMRHNNAPYMEDLQDMQLSENQPFSLQLKANEPDGDPIIYQTTNLPQGASFDSQSGYFTWNPTFEQSGTYQSLIFRVIEQNENGLSANDTINLVVNHVNRMPDLPVPENHQVDENTLLTFVIPEGSDPDREDQERLTYRAEKLPEGSVFDPASRQFTWTPTYDQSGKYIVDFIIDDGGGGIDREPVTIDIRHVDRKPVIDDVASQVVAEGNLLEVEISGTEMDSEDQDKISFVMENLPEGAQFDPETRIFSWTPTFDQSGAFQNITAIMTAGALRDTTEFRITVDHVNRVPVLETIGAKLIDENSELSFTLSGSDSDTEDTGKLTYAAEGLPEGATFDPQSQQFSWTPSFEQSGDYPNVSFSVIDPDGLVASESITISVSQVNRPPVLAEVTESSVEENRPLIVQLSASDPDREDEGKLVFSADNLPEGASIDSTTGLLEWLPGYDQSGSYDMTLNISDGQYTDNKPYRVVVTHVNRPPTLDLILPSSVDENQPLNFIIAGKDPDIEDKDQLTYAATDLPEGAAFDPATRTFSWTPTFEQSGAYPLEFSVTDPSGLDARQKMLITVNHVNRAPSLQAISAQSINENEPLTVQLEGNDADTEDAGKLVYGISDIPASAQIDAATGSFTWTPGFDQSGSYSLTATVEDSEGLTDSKSFTVTVNHVNRPPVITALPTQNGSENEEMAFTIEGSDPDSEDEGKLLFSSVDLPSGATLDRSSGQFSWTPGFEQSGSYTFTVAVQDGFNEKAEQSFTVEVAHVNQPPALTLPQPMDFTEGSENSFTLPEGFDPDPEDEGKLSYEVAGLPSGASFDSQTRVLKWTPDFDQAGEHNPEYTVTDGLAAVTQPLVLRVANVNRPPTIVSPGNQQVDEEQSLNITLQVDDPDAEDRDNLTVEAFGLPQGANFDGNNRTFSWTPGKLQQGNYSLRFVVKDSQNLSQEVTIEVVVNDIPEEVMPAPVDSTGDSN